MTNLQLTEGLYETTNRYSLRYQPVAIKDCTVSDYSEAIIRL